MFISILIVSAMVIILNLISVTGVLCFVLYLAAYWVSGYHILKKAGKDKLRLVFRKFFEHVLQQIHSGKLFDGKMFMDVAD